jgi:type IV secretory pathway TraG/TraD family ATPase VirD4
VKAFVQALLCLLTPGVLPAQQPFQFNTYYMCGTAGRVSVASCVDRSDKPYNDCIVQYWDKPRMANGMPPGASIGYHQLTIALPRCRLLGPVQAQALSRPSAPTRPTPFPAVMGRPSPSIPGLSGLPGNTLLILMLLTLVGYSAYKRIYFSRFLIVRRSNKQAIQAFGSERTAREQAIVDAFDSNNFVFKLRGENRAKQVMMWFELWRDVRTFRRYDLESLRYAYFAYNRGLLDEEKFYTYRITAMFQQGNVDPSHYGYLGWLAFWRKMKTRGEIGRARAAVAGFAQSNTTPNLHNQTLAAIQRLCEQFPQDEFFADMKRRFMEGARWLGVGDIKRSAFRAPDQPTSYALNLGVLDGTNVPLKYSGDGSMLTVAPPGSGKTTCNVVPALLRWPGAAVVLDVKGEIYDLTSRYRSTLGPIIRFSPLEPDRSQCYNPLTFVRRETMYVLEDAATAANMMLVPGKDSKNQFFENSARDLLTAIIADLAFWERPEDRPMSKVLALLNRNGWDEFIERLKMNPDLEDLRNTGMALANEDPETLANILSFARMGMTSWRGERIARTTKRSDWHPLDLRTAHPTIYICISPQEIQTYASLLRVFIAQHINVLMSGAVPAHGAEPILFLLDEFPQLGGMKPIETALEVGRGYGLRLWLFAQNFKQIEAAYPDATLMENCLVRTFLKPTSEMAARIAVEIGKAGMATGADADSSVSPQELSGPNFEHLQVVLGASSKPAKTRKLPYFKDPELVPRIGAYDQVAAAPAPARAISPLGDNQRGLRA